jgi:hypothetical protein
MATLFACTVQAQITFGVRGGISYTSLTQIVEEEVTYGGRAGFSVAGLMDIPLSQKFALRPELALVNLGGVYYVEYVTDHQPHLQIEKKKCNYYSIQVPMNITYKIIFYDWRFGVSAGPTVSLSTPVREKSLLLEE